MSQAAPLQGLTFLNTRDARGAEQLTRILQERGGEVVECPTIEFVPPRSWRQFDGRLARISKDDWIVFTSATAVQATLERLWELNRPPGVLSIARIAVIGRGTASTLQAENLEVALMPQVAQQEPLLEAMLANMKRDDKVWMPRAQEAREMLVEGLEAQGYEVTVTPVYRTLAPKAGLEPAIGPIRENRIDWLLFTSTSTVTHFFDMMDTQTRRHLEQHTPHVACIGAVTAEAARRNGLPVSVVPARQDLTGMVDAIVAQVTGSEPEDSGTPGEQE